MSQIATPVRWAPFELPFIPSTEQGILSLIPFVQAHTLKQGVGVHFVSHTTHPVSGLAEWCFSDEFCTSRKCPNKERAEHWFWGAAAGG